VKVGSAVLAFRFSAVVVAYPDKPIALTVPFNVMVPVLPMIVFDEPVELIRVAPVTVAPPERVVSPVTLSVPPTVSFPVTLKDASVVPPAQSGPTVKAVEETLLKEQLPTTAKVLANEQLPVTVEFPVTLDDASVVAPAHIGPTVKA
jgi:hypothetical protein